jgi:serine phosphatase RsbU (regulator of sigma subunit)/streptogramin lyase
MGLQRIYTLLIFLCTGLSASYAQALFKPLFQQLEAERFGLKNMSRLCMSSNGDLWGAHDNGIFKYDGYALERFDKQKDLANGILSEKIAGLFMDVNDQLWIWYTDTICLTQFDLATEKATQFTNIPKALITNIKRDSKQRLWVCTWGEGFYQFNPRTQQVKKYLPHTFKSANSDELKNRVKDITELPDGLFYIACFTNEFSDHTSTYFNSVTEKFESFPIQDYVKDLESDVAMRIEQSLRIAQFAYCDGEANIWVGTYSGLVLLDRRAKKAIRITGRTQDVTLNLDNARFYLVDERQNLWIGTVNSGIMYVDTKTRSAHYIKNDPNVSGTLADNRPKSILKDKDGTILVSTSIGVISIYYPISQVFNIAAWNDMDLEFNNRSEQRIPVNQVLVGDDGLIYVSSEKGIAVYSANDKKVVKQYLPNFQLFPNIDKETANSSVKDMRFIGKNKMQVIGANFPAQLDLTSGKFTHLKNDSLRNNYRMRLLFRHSKDTSASLVYIAKKREVLNLFEQTSSMSAIHKQYAEEMSKHRYYKETFSFRLKSGNWLISFGEKEFCIYDVSKKKTIFYNATSKTNFFPDSTIQTAYKDNSGAVWFATSNGLYLFDEQTGKSKYSNYKFGLKTGEGVNALIETKDGNWWLALNKQLVLWDAKQKRIYRFDAKLGLHYNNFLGSVAQTDALGRLYFATFNGELFFDPKSINTPTRQPLLSLKRFSIKDSLQSTRVLKQLVDGEKEFSWNENFLLFEISSNQIFAPAAAEYKYRLLGLDTNWTDNGTNQKIRYTNLASGSYTLEVESINAYHVISERLHVAFVIDSPFWKTWWFYLLLILILGLAFYTFLKYRERAYLKTQQILEDKIEQRTQEIVNKAKEIERQKEIIEEKNNELTDSIYYAQRIQQSILPGEDEIKCNLPQHAILFLPKDIVSGDFYWFTKQGDSLLWAVVDCTGHGVPGGFMSMLGSGLLNQIVNEEKRLQPDEILNLLRERVILALRQSGQIGENKDGMDICLCRYIPSKNLVQFAGANNGVYIVRNGELIELEPDKQPIGIYIGQQKSFTLKEILIEDNDVLYMTSDGYIDQFGGPKGKKFKSMNFEKMIKEIGGKSISEQAHTIEQTFYQWKGNYEQLDDVCVMSVKF